MILCLVASSSTFKNRFSSGIYSLPSIFGTKLKEGKLSSVELLLYSKLFSKLSWKLSALSEIYLRGDVLMGSVLSMLSSARDDLQIVSPLARKGDFSFNARMFYPISVSATSMNSCLSL